MLPQQWRINWRVEWKMNWRLKSAIKAQDTCGRVFILLFGDILGGHPTL